MTHDKIQVKVSAAHRIINQATELDEKKTSRACLVC